jgi:hypothetical protein
MFFIALGFTKLNAEMDLNKVKGMDYVWTDRNYLVPHLANVFGI